jgi:hypothetical protein
MENYMMKISESTFDVLKNFSTINPSLAFKKGSKLRTVSPQKNILAEAKISESFPVNFGIYELNKFLGLTTLFDDADFEFEDTSVKIKEGRNVASYTYTDESMINTPPEKNIELPSTEVMFSLPKDSYRKVLTGANQLQLPEVVVRGKDGVISLVATDTKNPTTNEYSIEVGTSPATFQFIFKTENLKLIVDDYDVKISKTGIAEFNGTRVNYWVATEKDSTYDI